MLIAFNVAERLIDLAGAEFGDKIVRQATRAISDVANDWPSKHEWTWYYSYYRLQLVAPYDTGTVTFASGANTLTLTGGTWPTWAASGYVRIGDVVVKVATRTSDTVVVLDSNQTLSADLADQDFTIFQDTYDLPSNFLATDNAIAESRLAELRYVRPQDWAWSQRTGVNTGTPHCYTFFPSPNSDGRYALKLYPYPDRAMTLDFVYRRRMASITRFGYETYNGTVAVASLSANVIGTATAFKSGMVNAYLLASGDANPPDGRNRPVITSKIVTVGSATTMTITDAVSADVGTNSGLAYRISEAIDVDDATMSSAFYWACALAMAQDMKFDPKVMASIQQAASTSLIEAKEADSRVFGRRVVQPGGPFRGAVDVATGADDT